ncbi:unnamed protein product [Angiostrongylus costaricensis]|uniref:DNA replication ATP-dependent helicase/nuclease n=1 Tax=Angiostrongylus costaricensis TaxID=334426 RepID=A0A158PG67_ANGCS|nr:unnamed protein product [Angiostrongylus costaricensis]
MTTMKRPFCEQTSQNSSFSDVSRSSANGAKKTKSSDGLAKKKTSTPVKRTSKVETATGVHSDFSDWDESPIKQSSSLKCYSELQSDKAAEKENSEFEDSFDAPVILEKRSAALRVLEPSHEENEKKFSTEFQEAGAPTPKELDSGVRGFPSLNNPGSEVELTVREIKHEDGLVDLICTTSDGQDSVIYLQDWLISNEHGVMIVAPDTLVPCTSITSATWCPRKVVLSERFRGPSVANKAMLIGIVVHELFQVHDIEETIWSPQLGIKGKVDVTMEVMLYSLMLSSHYKQPIVDGSLLYLKDGISRNVQPRALEMKAIINQRNNLANYFSSLNADLLPEYFKKWIKWIYLEWSEDQVRKARCISDLWRKPVEIRESEGFCAPHLVLVSQISTSPDNSSTLLTFHSASEISETVFAPGNMCLISTSTKPGFLLAPIIESSCSERLRKLIIDLEPPTVSSAVSSLPHSVHKILSSSEASNEINEEQKKAVQSALLSDDYTLVEGFPGSVLLTANTHSALDNVLAKLRKYTDDSNMLRLGKSSSARESVAGLTLDSKLISVEGDRYEATKRTLINTVLEPVALAALYTCRHFVLVGDANQLAPLVQNKKCAEEGMSVSLFERLQVQKNVLHSLTSQYRMNSTIVKLSSHIFYQDRLVCGSEEVAKACLMALEGFRVSTSEGAWKLIESGHLEDSVVFIDTCAPTEPTFSATNNGPGSLQNFGEARLACEVVSRFIAVILPFRFGNITNPRSLSKQRVDVFVPNVNYLVLANGNDVRNTEWVSRTLPYSKQTATVDDYARQKRTEDMLESTEPVKTANSSIQ